MMEQSVIAFDSSLHGSRLTVRVSTGPSVTTDNITEAMEFLTAIDDRHRVVWEVNTFLAPLAALLPKKEIGRLMKYRRAEVGGYYELLLVPDQVLYVIRGDRWIPYTCVNQYYGEAETPRRLTVVAEKMAAILEAVEGIGVHPEKITTHNNLLAPLHAGLDLPSWVDLPAGDDEGVCGLAYECSRKLWREAHALGHFDKAWNYDLSGAYPSAARSLEDPRHGGHWEHSGGERPRGAAFGFLEGWIETDSDLAPFVFKDRNGDNLNPTGRWYTALASPLVDLLDNYSLGAFEPDNAYWWVHDGGATRFPLAKHINRLWELRQKSPVLDRLLKKYMQVAYYGTFLQRKYDGMPGERFFPPWAALIEAQITVKVVTMILNNKVADNVLYVVVDSALLDAPAKNVRTGTGLGDWREEVGPALIVGFGTCFHGERTPSGISYGEAMAMIEKHPDAIEWSKPVKAKVGLAEVVSGGDQLADLGKTVQKPQGFSIKHDHDRNFEASPTVGADLLENQYYSRAFTMRQLSRQRPECRQKRGE